VAGETRASRKKKRKDSGKATGASLPARTYTLVPKGDFRKTLRKLGLGGLSLQVTEKGGAKAVRIGPWVPQGRGCFPPFGKMPCLVTDFFKEDIAKKVAGPRRGPVR
jgi:hypothetical protein